MLTMFDTFYGPFEQFTSWFLFDCVEKSYDSSCLLFDCVEKSYNSSCFLFDIEKSYDSSDYLGDSTTTARIQLPHAFNYLNGKE